MIKKLILIAALGAAALCGSPAFAADVPAATTDQVSSLAATPSRHRAH